MDWQHPKTLYLIVPICIGWIAIALYSQSKRARARLAFVNPQMLERIMPEPSRARFWIKTLLLQIAFVSGLVGLAGPQFGDQVEQITPRGSDLYVLIDVSRSMLADDVPPSRLGRAKADVSALVNQLEGERIGLIAFAGQAVVKCPLTVDYSSFRRSLEELDPNSAPKGGTAIGDAIRKSLEVFQGNAERDQAILLITDGDDQQSYPLEAAALAGERKVTIFAVGLGDSDRGARIPQKASKGSYVEYEGEQVWSKLDGGLLQQIAMKTSGVYVPAGTRAYDLGELYGTYLRGRRGNDSTSQTRIRRSERFQIFLAISLIALIIQWLISPFKKTHTGGTSIVRGTGPIRANVARTVSLWVCTVAAVALQSQTALADDSVGKVRTGLKHYADQKYEEAQIAFADASAQLEKDKSPQAAIAAFDEACALHRKGDFDKARDKYLQAGLSQNRNLAISAHFNLGMLVSEKARTLAGDEPESVAKEKRQEIVDILKQSIGSYRHCLELDPKHEASRKNIELTRQWIKYYNDRWNELDRQKRRDETNLFQFLEFIIKTQTAIRGSVVELQPNATADLIAEIKRLQHELADEIPVLKDKIDGELRPKKDANQPTATSDTDIEEGIKLLQNWVDSAADHMHRATLQMTPNDVKKADGEQQAALEDLDLVWDAIVRFHPLLAADLAAQTALAKELSPGEATNTMGMESSDVTQPLPKPQLVEEAPQWASLLKSQEKTLRKSRLILPKAESELGQLEEAPTDPNTPTGSAESVDTATDVQAPGQSKITPEQIKAGYEKAIELAPNAVHAMELAIEQLKKKDRVKASEHAEEARRILQEIQDAQPKDPKQNQQSQSNDNQDQKNEQSEEDKKDKEQKTEGDKESPEEQNPKDQNQEPKKDPGDKQDSPKKDSKEDNQKPTEKSPQLSKDRLEDALRKVREREQSKRERDRELKARVLGRAPVDKDW